VFGIEFNKEQKLVLYVLIGLSAIGISYNHAGNTVASGEVVLREPGQGARPRVAATDSDSIPTSNPQYSTGKVVFQVVGCVNKPGVYSLPIGSRVIDAVGTAGGAKQGADLQTINLAAKVEDGSRISVPSVYETRPMGGNARGVALRALSQGNGGGGSRSGGDKLRTPGEGLVHINSAAVDELQRLPGVGPVTAEKIIEYRRQVGKFARPEQLMDVRGIGPKKFEKMRPFVAL
jgi:competence protein ComEA